MTIRNPLKSRIGIILTSADIWGSLRILNDHAIPVSSVQPSDALSVYAEIRARDIPLVRKLLKKRGDKIEIKRYSGFFLWFKRIKARPVLVIGSLMILTLFLVLPTRVLFVQIEGNHSIPTQRILEAAACSGIRTGASRKEIRSEKIKNALLSQIPELQWAGINTYGCRAVISVQERAASGVLHPNGQAVSSIVAQTDGIITSVSVVSGNVLCQEGQAVKRGQVLISGYTDCGLSLRAGRAEGEVFAQTIRTQEFAMPDSCVRRGEKSGEAKRFSLIIGKKRINLWKGSGIWDSTCGRIKKEYRIILPGGYSVPIVLCCEILMYYPETVTHISKAEAQAVLADFSCRYLEQQMIAGTVGPARTSFKSGPGYYLLSGEYQCTEMIGREHIEAGAPYEQNS